MKIYERGDAAYAKTLAQLSRRGDADLARVETAVRAILNEVKSDGDDGVRAATERFESRLQTDVLLDEADWRARAEDTPEAAKAALREAADRIRRYHEHQVDHGFRYTEDGIELGQRVRPIGAVGVYAPGGKARYPSTGLMTAVVAQGAGVPRIVRATPNPTPELRYAGRVSGVTEGVGAGGGGVVGGRGEAVRRGERGGGASLGSAGAGSGRRRVRAVTIWVALSTSRTGDWATGGGA